MTDATPAIAAPTAEELAAAAAVLARATAAAAPVEDAMAELCARPDFASLHAELARLDALYPREFSRDLNYAVLSLDRLVARYVPAA